MTNVTKLPSAAESYFTLGTLKGGWTVVLVTPAGRKNLRTALTWSADRETAIEKGREIAAERQRPFVMGRAR